MSHDDSGNVPRDRNEQPTCKKNARIVIMVIITTIIIIIKDTRENGA